MTVEEVRKKIKYLELARGILEIEPRNLTEEIFVKYIELERTEKVAAHLNENGHRMKSVRGERKYISTDITEVLDKEDNYYRVNERIYNLAKFMQRRRYRSWEEKVIGYFEEGSDRGGKKK